jgi:hypothetical protein
MKTATLPEDAPAAPATEPAAPTKRLPNVGDVVFYGVSAGQGAAAWQTVPVPAIIVRVEKPLDPASEVFVQPFGTDSRFVSLVHCDYSPSLKLQHWTWRTPPPAPEPFK